MIPTPIAPDRGRIRKYGSGVSTLPLLLRTGYTVVMLGAGMGLGIAMVKAVTRADNRVSTLVLFLLGLWAMTMLLTLPHVWRPSAEWRRQQYESRRLERRLRAAFEPRVVRNLALRGLIPACGVCGQDGPVLVRARTQCSACQRPWVARDAAPPRPAQSPARAA